MTDFRARGTIMGPTGLTAVFGMGTGVTPPVWSPEKRPAGGQAAPGAGFNRWSDHASQDHCGSWQGRPVFSTEWTPTAAGSLARGVGWGTGHRLHRDSVAVARQRGGRTDRGGQAIRLLGPVRCDGRPPYTPGPSTWSSSRSLRT